MAASTAEAALWEERSWARKGGAECSLGGCAMCLCTWGSAWRKGLTLLQRSWGSAQPKGKRKALWKHYRRGWNSVSSCSCPSVCMDAVCRRSETGTGPCGSIISISGTNALVLEISKAKRGCMCLVWAKGLLPLFVRDSGTQEKSLGKYRAKDRLVVPSHKDGTWRVTYKGPKTQPNVFAKGLDETETG